MKQTVYIPTKIKKDEIALYVFNNDDCVFFAANKVEAHVFTDEELLELKKKWMEEAFDNGIKTMSNRKRLTKSAFGDNGIRIDTTGLKTDKDTYINNITL